MADSKSTLAQCGVSARHGTPAEEAVTAAGPLLTVQVLRAVAATLVLIGHVQGEVVHIAAASGASYARLLFLPGGFGVDLFFCISGFIMMVSSRSLFATPGASRSFFMRRLIRLVPLYWLMTFAYLVILLLGSRGYSGDLSSALVTSLAFIPFPAYGQAGGLVFPLYSLGWTLNYEMFFYLLFALFVGLPFRRAAAAILATLAILVLWGGLAAPQAVPLHFWTQPIILEFGLGVLIGSARLGQRMHRVSIRIALCVAALMLLLWDPMSLAVKVEGTSTANDFSRLLGWGIPAALLLLAAVLHERSRRAPSAMFRRLAYLGDCSYSLYLVHPFVILVLAKSWKLLQLDQHLPWAILAAAMIAGAIACSVLVHRAIEKPMTRWLRDRFEWRPRAVVHAGP